ncbi:hypothetical protein QTV49_004351 [Vibrio vulnificus]|nr:hypothetical protein [Vibrio vulnificus]
MFKVINTYYSKGSDSPLDAIKEIVGEDKEIKQVDDFIFDIKDDTRSYIITKNYDDFMSPLYRIDECLEFEGDRSPNTSIRCPSTNKLLAVNEGALRAPNSALKL